MTTGIWHHVAYTFDDTSKQQILYLNGIQVASGTGIKSIGYDTNSLLLGRDHAYGAPYFTSFLNGSLDEAAIYNRALSGAEIASIYNAGVLGKRPPLPSIILRASVEAGVVLISFDATVGGSYTIQSANALGTNVWFVLTNFTAVSTNVAFSDSLSHSPQRFYRVLKTGN